MIGFDVLFCDDPHSITLLFIHRGNIRAYKIPSLSKQGYTRLPYF